MSRKKRQACSFCTEIVSFLKVFSYSFILFSMLYEKLDFSGCPQRLMNGYNSLMLERNRIIFKNKKTFKSTLRSYLCTFSIFCDHNCIYYFFSIVVYTHTQKKIYVVKIVVPLLSPLKSMVSTHSTLP